MTIENKSSFAKPILLALLAFVGGMTIGGCSKEPDLKTKNVVYATRDVPLPRIVVPDDVEEKQLDATKVPEDAVTEIDMATGHYSRGLKKGQLVTRRYLVAAGGLVNPVLPSVVHAIRTIPAGCYIDPDALEEASTDLEKIPDHIFECNKKTFANSYARSDIKRGQMLSFAMYLPEKGKHYVFAATDISKDTPIIRAELQLEDPITQNADDSVVIEKVLTSKLKRNIKRGQQITNRDLH